MNEYDEQIAMLTQNPQRIQSEWASAKGLFKFVSDVKGHKNSACLTMIKHNQPSLVCKAIIKGEVDEALTTEIQADERLPKKPEDITIAHLPVFKEWQERIDKLQTA